ncbi:sensor domain-containing diguanylate cyclase [Alteromonas ponticola]|uniref:Diguanylate cyclase n=1 Tax=Alteromonas ponticola TaxID=2720613 RepID=A0ABX1R4X0_9ALTE|nr:sensor domain-containing diguanylate cyclase [Alteromonas ponticola]NMH60522.1 diguanylate cyclase [Alteromonas ponticola]
MNKSGLLVRLAVVIGFASLAIGFLSTQLFYRITVNQEINIANQSIESLFKTVQATAATAAYLAEQDLAQEVVDGLTTNDVVRNVVMTFEGKTVRANEEPLRNPVTFPIASLFEPDRAIGEMQIAPNIDYIKTRAEQLAGENSKAMIMQAAVVTVVAIFVAFYLITRPMIMIARALHRTTPGDGSRLAVPDFHGNSELGVLVSDVNKLLDKTEAQFSQERQLREEIEALEKRFRMLFEKSISPIILMEPRGNILLYNSAFEETLEKLGKSFRKSFGPLLEDLFVEPEALASSVEMAFANDEIATGEFRLRSDKETESMWAQVIVTSIISDDMREYYQVTLHDISKRKRELDLLAYQADFDKLTKLHNRQGLEKHLHNLIDVNTPFTLVLMDLNWFKQVNDIYGHKSGDEILIFVADKIKKAIRPNDLAGRWGGDEFVLILKNADQTQTTQVVERLVRLISKPYYLRKFEQNVTIGASAGAASFPTDSSELQALLHLADQAMYQAKKVKDTSPEDFLRFAEPIDVEQDNA